MSTPPVSLITGGAGFIGTNLAHQLALAGREVIVFDNLSRDGVRRNLDWLTAQHPGKITLLRGDVRDGTAVRAAVDRADEVFHLAAQVAVTTSLNDPLQDFETNARGTLHVLEALRAQRRPVPLIYTSTNKVYGALTDVALERTPTRYVPRDPTLRTFGINEQRSLDFHSPYGCSKGCADQYVLDYARTFDLPVAVFRMSCIYGPHQQGNEDQGWVAHFLLSASRGTPLTIFGDGLQVRDVLFVDDLVRAFLLARQNIDRLAGQAFNVGGGTPNTLSLAELIAWLREHSTTSPPIRYSPARLGDQRYYVSDTAKFCSATGWHPQVTVTEGLQRLHAWLSEASELQSAGRADSAPVSFGAVGASR
jgi:CDP-paratose 2-epimerase